MKVVLAAVGSDGDVAPMASIGLELVRRGHDVTVIALERYARSVAESGLQLERISAGPSPLWPDNRALRRLALSQSGAMFATMVRSFGRLAPHTTRALLNAASDADVVVSGTVTRGACQVLAEKTGAAHVSVLYAPLLPASDASATSLGLRGAGGAVTLGSSHLMWTLTRALGAAHTAHMVRRTQRLWITESAPTTLLATSPVVSPPAATWPSYVEQVGWVRSAAGRPPLPDEVRRFLDDGPPPVAMTFGSSPSAHPEADRRLFVEAARRAGVRVLVPGVEQAARRADRKVLFTGAMNFQALMPRLAAVVHHGGAGTTYTALEGGVPAVVVPHLGDQGYYARRVAELGAGLKGAPRWRLKARRLARLVESALDDALGERAREVSVTLRQEPDGATVIADRIEASSATS